MQTLVIDSEERGVLSWYYSHCGHPTATLHLPSDYSPESLIAAGSRGWVVVEWGDIEDKPEIPSKVLFMPPLRSGLLCVGNQSEVMKQ